MAYIVHDQYLNQKTGFHVIVLQDEAKNRHIVQIAIGFDACPACGRVTPKDNTGAIDPKAMVAAVIEQLNAASEDVAAYAKKHNLKVK